MDYEVAKFDKLVGTGRVGFRWLIKHEYLQQKKDALHRKLFQALPQLFNITFEGEDRDVFGVLEITVSRNGSKHKVKGYVSGAKADLDIVECAEGRIPAQEVLIVSVRFKELQQYAERPKERRIKETT